MSDVVPVRIRANALLGLMLIGCVLAQQPAHAEPVLKVYDTPAADFARLTVRTACSCIFVQRMPTPQCLNGEAEIYRYLHQRATPAVSSPDQSLEIAIDAAGGAVVTLKEKKQTLAYARFIDDGGGCVTNGREPAPTSKKETGDSASHAQPLPRGALPPDVDSKALESWIDEGFSKRGRLPGYTRALMIVHDGNVVVERYGPGFTDRNRYYLGSVSKTLNNFLAGLLVRDGKLRVSQPVALPSWRKPGDPRGKITFDQMLHMTSGLSWEEEFFRPGANGYEVFFAGAGSVDVAKYMADLPLEAKPGEHYEYSTGASILLGHALQWRIGDGAFAGRKETLSYLHRELFEPIGALDVVPEFDSAETLLTGEAVFGRSEDLARLGLLLLQNGRWQGKQILPTNWVEYSTSMDLAKSKEEPYGAQLELNYVVPGCFGHTGVGAQKLIVCPKRKLVMVWLASDFDLYGWGDYPTLSAAYDRLKELQAKIVRAFPESR